MGRRRFTVGGVVVVEVMVVVRGMELRVWMSGSRVVAMVVGLGVTVYMSG